jgi:hypothetical protein
MIVDPIDVLIDGHEATAGGIMGLRQMFVQHALTESRVIPWNLFSLCPWFGNAFSINDIK